MAIAMYGESNSAIPDVPGAMGSSHVEQFLHPAILGILYGTTLTVGADNDGVNRVIVGQSK